MGRLVQRVIDAESRELIRELTRDPDPGVLWDARFDLLPLSTSANEGQLKAALKAMGLTLTRASGATVQVSSSQIVTGIGVDAPRVGNGGYGSGLVIEESRTCLTPRSTAVGTVPWGPVYGTETLTANYGLAPDGNTTGARTLSVTTLDSGVYYSYGGFATQKYTASLWAKRNAGADQSFRIRLPNTAGSSNQYSGTLIAGSTWARKVFSAQVTAGTGTSSLVFGALTGVAYDMVLWGGQLEAGAFPTELIITGAATATRAADVLKVDRWNRAVDRGSIGIEFSFVPKCRPADSTVDQWLFGDTGSNLWIAVTLAGQVSMRTTAVSPAVTGAGVTNWNAGDSVKVYVEMGGGKAYLALSVNGVVSKPALSNTNQLDIPDNHASEPRLFNYQGTYLTNCWARRVRTFRKGVRPQWAR